MASDIFVSLADNIQETFGLSVIEAMASSLPLVVSDWNGYKDLVNHGFNGFRIPTEMLTSSLTFHDSVDRSYGLGLLPYDNMIGLRSMLTTIDYDKLYRTLKLFIIHPSLKLHGS